MPTTLTGQLVALARTGSASLAGHGPTPAAHTADEPGTSGADPRSAGPGSSGPVVLADRSDGTVVALGPVVAKAHPADTEPGELAARLRTAAHPLLAGILLPPLDPAPAPEPPARPVPGPPAAPPAEQPHAELPCAARQLESGRLATLWPRGTPVDPDDEDAVPWEEAGALLARLHSVPPGPLAPLPPMRGPVKAARAMHRMRTALSRTAPPTAPSGPTAPSAPTASAVTGPRSPGGPPRFLREAAHTVERAWDTLPPWCRAECPPPPSLSAGLCHGDFHLGQLVRDRVTGGSWRLIDIDDLGTGDPAWDLARPAAWYAAGLLPAPDFHRFWSAYTAAGGRGGPDPWPWLDAPARALTAQTAALGVAKAHEEHRTLNEAERACVDACFRIAAAQSGPHADSRPAPASAASPGSGTGGTVPRLPPDQGL